MTVLNLLDNLKKDKDISFYAIKKDPKNIKFIDNELKQNKTFILKAHDIDKNIVY